MVHLPEGLLGCAWPALGILFKIAGHVGSEHDLFFFLVLGGGGGGGVVSLLEKLNPQRGGGGDACDLSVCARIYEKGTLIR